MKAVFLFSFIVMLLLGSIITGCSPREQPVEDEPDEKPHISNDDQPSSVSDEQNGNGIYEITNTPAEEFRAVWVATVLNLDFPSRQDMSVNAMKREIDEIISRTAEMGLNAIIFQVRPTGDSFYESEIFPWSHWLSGTQGQGIPDFDPLAYWIEASHAKEIELHAWLNPYRVIHTSTNSSDPGTLSLNNPVYINPELAVAWTAQNGSKGLFLDPGLPEARQLIIDGIAEIALKYDIDGIHIDDYFYPGTDFNDAASFEQYGGGMNLADWRRENVNTLIKDIQTTISDINETNNKNIRWGISPSAIWKNDSNDPLGVQVPSTFESYHLLYADSRRWVTEGWIDYICPQIYWYIGFETADFEAIFDWWAELCKDNNVDLYIGHAAYREQQDDQSPNWRGEIIRQLEMVENSDAVTGSVFYRYHSIRGALGNAISNFYLGDDEIDPREPVMILDTLSVGAPRRDMTISATAANAPGFNIVGTSVPGVPLYLNGEEVINRTIEGFFFVYAPLESGENEFVFSQEGQEDVIRKITRNTAASGGGGGGASGGGESPAATITQITSPRYATVITDDAWLYPSNSIIGGSDWMLQRGQRDRVVAESSNNFVKLSCGMWINKNAVTIENSSASGEASLTEDALKNGVYHTGTNFDVIAWRSEEFSAIHAVYDGTALTVNFGMHTDVPPLTFPDDLSRTIFSDYSSGIENDVPYYKFIIRNDVHFEGQFVTYEYGVLRLHLKKRKTLARGDHPLIGITIVLDPGHGGDYSGALGPLGLDFPEKELNLINAQKLAERLRELGADVYLTRETDIDMSLQERVDISWQHKADLFVSLHINSVAETTNAENIRGFTVWHRNPNSINISQSILNTMFDIIPGTNRLREINRSNFFVCRPAWTPSVLLEAGFIVNIDDFVWLIDPEQQDKMAEATTKAIINYFGTGGY
ncbi:MAG: family 10 glycosylhydrolase [Oscillospiraceae bacterium]|nr:family 10 glycosylhydrolase [Oscillospiraceae bacterium]